MDQKHSPLKSYLVDLERIINSMDDESFNRLRGDLDRIKRAIKRKSRSMSVPISKSTLAAAHRHCAKEGLEMAKWVDQAVSAALEKADARPAAEKGKQSRKIAKKLARAERRIREAATTETMLVVSGDDFLARPKSVKAKKAKLADPGTGTLDVSADDSLSVQLSTVPAAVSAEGKVL
jgi:hypothetical protein